MRRAIALAALVLAGAGCASVPQAQRERAAALVEAARATTLDCDQPDACARPSPLHALAARAFVEATPEAPRHYALILDRGPDALLARVDLLRSATTSVDLQTYIFDEDDAGRLVMHELVAAARRGVHVRVLIDQLSALKRIDTLAALAGAHANLEVRIYNPVFDRAKINYPQYLFAAACCWRQLNQRMHTKLLLIDGAVGISGGRNYQDDYYDWDGEYNFRDRDVLVAGPVARRMGADFASFWDDKRSVPAALLGDVARRLLKVGVPALPPPQYVLPARAAALSRAADDPEATARLAAQALPVGPVEYLADLPDKHGESAPGTTASSGLRGLIESARHEVLLQTPYLVLSEPAQAMFRAMHQRAAPPRVVISTNSLASTDSFITYAISYKYKRRYMRDFGFEIHEFKPFPASAPIDLDATGKVLPPLPPEPDAAAKALTHERLRARSSRESATDEYYRRPLETEYAALRYARRRANERVPLQRAGVRVGLHAKSMVIDERVGVVGTHNFDPRGDTYNTEAAVVVDDPAFARALAASIRGDTAPENAWTIGRRDDPPMFSGLEYNLARLSEHMPVFDLWPVRYATSYEFVPGPDCPKPLSPYDRAFRRCYRPVGDFPEVQGGFKSLLTRIFTAFGAGLAPIL